MLADAPFYADVADGPEGGKAFWATGSDGVKVRVGHWAKPDAKGTVLLFPGRTEYVEKYGRAAKDLAKRGYATLTIDWRGQGLADRLLPERLAGHVGEFEDYQVDVRALVDAARSLGAPEPFYLIAHSMGGGIGLMALHDDLPVKAAAFSAPMWGIQIAPALRPVAWVLSTVLPRVGLGHTFPPRTNGAQTMVNDPFDGNFLTKDAEMYDYMVSQLRAHPDLGLGAPTVHWLGEALEGTKDLASRQSPDLPCVTFLGTDEKIVDCGRIKSVMSGWQKGRLEIVSGAEHEVMMEVPTVRAQFFDEADALFSAHT